MSKTFENEDISIVINKYGDMVKRISFLYFSNKADVEDIFQEVFLKYFLNKKEFQDENHKKAWICRVTFNICKDLKKSFWRKKVISVENIYIPFESEEQSELVTAVLKLPSAYKNIIYMHYYEGFTIPEIAEASKKNINTIYSQLRRAKAKLRKELGEIEL
ncbi:MAG: sigma-70 family RNA polymerase sigma factor [Firmicutes bacterium]|nr:sigma-70 family RNA polymerase sigma factor [Bacillota bacterium]